MTETAMKVANRQQVHQLNTRTSLELDRSEIRLHVTNESAVKDKHDLYLSCRHDVITASTSHFIVLVGDVLQISAHCGENVLGFSIERRQGETLVFKRKKEWT